MPEVIFKLRWPDASETLNYSPSSIIREFFTPGASLALPVFLATARAAMQAASDRVFQVHGFPCSQAAATLANIELNAARFTSQPEARITVLELKE